MLLACLLVSACACQFAFLQVMHVPDLGVGERAYAPLDGFTPDNGVTNEEHKPPLPEVGKLPYLYGRQTLTTG